MSVVLTSNAVYQPFTFEELLKPLAMYTEEYRNVEENIADLESKSELIKRYAMEDPNSEAARMYTEYAQNLDKQVEALAKYGLPSVNRRSLYNLKSQYSSNITPIEIAIARRAEDAKAQQEARMKDPTLFLSRNASMTSLDDYIRNPNLSYSSYSGDTLAKQVAEQTQGFANKLRNVAVSGTSDPYVNAFLENYGYTMEDVRQAMQNPQGVAGMGILNDIVNNVVAQSGIHTWDNWNEIKGEVYRHAGRGLVAGIGKDNLSFREDYGAKRAAMRADEIWKRGLDGDTSTNGVGVPIDITGDISTASDQSSIFKNIGERVIYNPTTNTFTSDKIGELENNIKTLERKYKNKYGKSAEDAITYYNNIAPQHRHYAEKNDYINEALEIQKLKAQHTNIGKHLQNIISKYKDAVDVLGNEGFKYAYDTERNKESRTTQEIIMGTPTNTVGTKKLEDIRSNIIYNAERENKVFYTPQGELIKKIDSSDLENAKIYMDPKTNKVLIRGTKNDYLYKGDAKINKINQILSLANGDSVYNFDNESLKNTTVQELKNVEKYKDEEILKIAFTHFIRTQSPIVHIKFNNDIRKYIFDTDTGQLIASTSLRESTKSKSKNKYNENITKELFNSIIYGE